MTEPLYPWIEFGIYRCGQTIRQRYRGATTEGELRWAICATARHYRRVYAMGEV